MPRRRFLCLIDAHSIIYRAFHALPELATSEGFPTGAVYGFVRMLVRVLKEKRPDRTAVVFDAKGPNFRHQLDPDYKANRPPMDPALAKQMDTIKKIVHALGLPAFEREGFEADDIIATLTRQAHGAGYEVMIVSGDKDLFQLLEEGVVMWDTMRDKVHDASSVEEAYGVGPKRLADLFGLAGDSSDNIPGVPGIGPKIAGQLIASYGDLETLLDKADQIKQPKRRQSLIENAQAARLSKRLFTLDDEVPLEVRAEELEMAEPDGAEMGRIFSRLEMVSLLKEITPHALRDGLGAEAEPDCRVLEGEEGLEALLAEARAAGQLALAVEFESEAGRPARILSLGLSAGETACSVGGEVGDYSQSLRGILADGQIGKVGADLKSDWLALDRAGLDLGGLDFDVVVADYLIKPGRRSRDLALLATEYLNQEMDLARPEMRAHAVWRLAEVLAPRLIELGLNGVFDEIEMPLIPVLIKMEQTGVRVDRGQLSRMSDDLSRRLEALSERIIEAAGFDFNPNSPQQLGQVLFEKLNLPQGKKTKKKTGYSTDAEVLEKLRPLHPLPGLVLDHRSLTKLKSTYVDALAGLIHPQTGRIHTHYNQTITATGRLSSSEPNLQNIPVRSEEGRLIRRAFVAPEGFLFVSADYSQIELRLLAHYAKDPALIEAFNRDEDIHTRTAAEIFAVMPGMVDAELRRQAKAINFGLIYGKTAYGLAQDLNISTGQAAKFIKAYFDRYTGVKRFQEETISQARKQGYVTTLWGRRRYLPDLVSSHQMKRKMAERMAINTPLQGSAADLIKRAMIALDQAIEERGLEARLILQVHDELIVEVRAEEAEEAGALVKEAMEGAARLTVPLKVEVGQGSNWDEAH